MEIPFFSLSTKRAGFMLVWTLPQVVAQWAEVLAKYGKFNMNF
ncbi:MAG: hypothetical protein ACTS4V_01190 [Candidatus Hodgkinia cicadicola]